MPNRCRWFVEGRIVLFCHHVSCFLIMLCNVDKISQRFWLADVKYDCLWTISAGTRDIISRRFVNCPIFWHCCRSAGDKSLYALQWFSSLKLYPRWLLLPAMRPSYTLIKYYDSILIIIQPRLPRSLYNIEHLAASPQCLFSQQYHDFGL